MLHVFITKPVRYAADLPCIRRVLKYYGRTATNGLDLGWQTAT